MSIDRLERRLPEVLTELSLPRTPDYIPDLLSRTERMPQRPGWTFLERWFPVSTITAEISSARRPALRPLLLLAVVAALLAASLAWYAGSQRRIPPPYGPAQNGLIVSNTQAGDLITIDPTTQAERILVTGPDICCASFSPDGQRIAYLNLPSPEANPTALTIVNSDGSVVREIPGDALRGLEEYEWSPAGERILLSYGTAPKILDVATGALTSISVPFTAHRASWIGTTGDILLTSRPSDTALRVWRLAAGSTTDATQIATLQYAVDAPKVSPDGSKFLYFIWAAKEGSNGRIHVYDLTSNADVEVSPPDGPGAANIREWENPVWSPDGSRIAVEMYTTGPTQIAILPASGGDPVIVGPSFPELSGGVAMRFSPDGESLLVTYRFSQATWVLPVDGTEGRQVQWPVAEESSWQRLAP